MDEALPELEFYSDLPYNKIEIKVHLSQILHHSYCTQERRTFDLVESQAAQGGYFEYLNTIQYI